MSLFDSLTGLVKDALGSTVGQQLESAVMQNLLKSGIGGGLGNILQQLHQAGLDQHVQSWISNGPNMPVSADQIQNALGHGQLATMAQSLGITPDMVSQELSKFLPIIVDKLTPHGTLPASPVAPAAR